MEFLPPNVPLKEDFSAIWPVILAYSAKAAHLHEDMFLFASLYSLFCVMRRFDEHGLHRLHGCFRERGKLC